MASLPGAAEAAIVRGMAAFMQASRKTDLLPSLRPLQGKHHRLLMARRAIVLAALDEEGVRALVLDWLEDKPAGIGKQDRETLQIAAERAAGWEQRLEDAFAETAPAAPAPRSERADVERIKERSRRARDEAKKAREEAKRDIAEHRRLNAELELRVQDLTERLRSLERELERVRNAAEVAAATNERELRKARKAADRAAARLDASEATIKELRRDLSDARAATAPPAKKRPAAIKEKPAVVAEPARRRRLPVPKGRLADAPETLAAWLSTADVHLLVDGYNVSKAEGGFGDVALERQRDLLLQAVEKVVRRHRIAATVVFDGSHVPPGASRRSRGPVEVEYSRPDEIADDHLIAKLETLPKQPVVVATNDRELQRRAARLGATIATAHQLLALIR